jgi:hypothetical protein
MSRSPAVSSSSDDSATVVAICHETLGHGLACLGLGGHVRLLASIWFRCSIYAPIIDAGGPLGNLIAGLLALGLLGYIRPGSTRRLFLFMFGALNLFWFTAQLAYESLTHTHDDWYWLLQSAPAIWRPVGAAVGAGGYILTGQWLRVLLRKQGGPTGDAIRLAYAAAAASAVVAGLMWQPERLHSALQGFLTLGIPPLGLLRVARASANAERDGAFGSVARSWIWICACAVLFVMFLSIQARGLGPLAASVLPRA